MNFLLQQQLCVWKMAILHQILMLFVQPTIMYLQISYHSTSQIKVALLQATFTDSSQINIRRKINMKTYIIEKIYFIMEETKEYNQLNSTEISSEVGNDTNRTNDLE